MDWRSWITGSRGAIQAGIAIAALALVAAAVTLAITLADVVQQRPVHDLTALLVVGLPLLVAGQLWMVGLITARKPPRPGGWNERLRIGISSQRAGFRNPRAFFFGELNPVLGWSFLVLATAGWLLAITAFPQIIHGNPTGAVTGCAYRLVNHGAYSCVTRATYERAGAGLQRFVCGILLGFYSLHAGAALGGLAQRRRLRAPV